jgi:type II secretory ATPase GspE/PulE/Tfp pilus assembly ATPase PilB-like protein
MSHTPSSKIHDKARELGMTTMREDGYLKALAGETTLKEVDRVAAVDGV